MTQLSRRQTPFPTSAGAWVRSSDPHNAAKLNRSTVPAAHDRKATLQMPVHGGVVDEDNVCFLPGPAPRKQELLPDRADL